MKIQRYKKYIPMSYRLATGRKLKQKKDEMFFLVFNVSYERNKFFIKFSV